MANKIRIGVIGLGSIFHRVMTDIPNLKNCELYAVAARDGARAAAEAEKYGAKRSFGSYEELASCPEVDLVYVATPNNLHREHVLLCLNHGKHVVCEKPFAMNVPEAEEMIACAREKGLFLMEAMWSRFMPAVQKAKQLCDEGAIGSVNHIYGEFSYASPFMPQSRIYDPKLGGGALLDVGIYPLSVGAYLLGGAPETWQCTGKLAPSGVDAHIAFQLNYPSGATAQYFAGVDTRGLSRMIVYGSKGNIEIPDFWHATSLIVNGETVSFPAETEGHRHEFDHAAEMIWQGKTESPVMPLDETLALTRLMTDMRKNLGVFYPGD